MQTQDRRFRKCAIVLAAAGAMMAGTAVQAADSSRKAQYERDVAACQSGTTGQSREDCMREAGAVLNEAKPNTRTASPQERMRNATQRCDNLPAADRQTCIETMTSSQTQVHGSVSGGGVLRERTIQVPATSVAPAAGTAPAAPGAYTAPAPAAAPMPGAAPGTMQPAPGAIPPSRPMPSGGTPLPPPAAAPAPGGPMGAPGAPGTNVR